jgi:AraC-like DNA-binding protein
LEYAIHGIKVPHEVVVQIGTKINDIFRLNGFERVLSLLDILFMISNNENLEFISAGSIPLHSVRKSIPKIDRVFEYVSSNFKNKIVLEEIASIVSMTPTAFCRFFKHKTLKTFSRFLIEVRMGNSCKMLVEGDYNTSECCFASGYNNVSNFHRHFRSVTNMSPTEFRTKFQKRRHNNKIAV